MTRAVSVSSLPESALPQSLLQPDARTLIAACRHRLIAVTHANAVAPFPDMLAALSRRIESPVKDIFATLRGYPERRDQAEAQMGAIRYPLERCQLACHQLLERVVRLKVW